MKPTAGRPVSVIVPAVDEAEHIAATLRSLTPLQALGGEIIVVDGGSGDATRDIARDFADRVLEAPCGRARQMNAGAAVAAGDILWFVHADTQVDKRACVWIIAIADDARVGWGRFGVRIASRRPLLCLTAWLMNQRSRLTGIATGDQGLFVRRSLFRAVGGFPEQPLMEDIAISARLRARQRPQCLPVGLETSARRWQTRGAVATILLMWRLRLAYWRGADPADLASRYR